MIAFPNLISGVIISAALSAEGGAVVDMEDDLHDYSVSLTTYSLSLSLVLFCQSLQVS